MNRKLKFRAWNLTQKRWEEKLGLYFDDGKIGDFSECFHNEEDSENYIVGQFTGILDENGLEIYEGDILEIECIELILIFKTGKSRATVKWCEKTLRYLLEDFDDEGFNPYFSQDSYRKYTVIGNIFENPNLLNEIN